MNKYPKINYIGNKEKIADWIVSCFPIKEGVVLDLFCGGCSVSYALKKKGFDVITNDVLYSNYCISKAIIENSTDYLDLNFDEYTIKKYFNKRIYNDILWLSNKLYFEDEIEELACLISFSNKLKGYKKFIFLALLRRAMIRKIPYSRMNIKWEEIVKLRDEEYSYIKYKRRRAYHNKSFIYHINDNLKNYNESIIKNGTQNKAYQKDSIDLIKNMKNNVDLIYIDPPYPSTMNKYNEFYGVFDKIFHKNITYTDFTTKNIFIENLIRIINLAKEKTNYIAISLNNKSNPSYEELSNELYNIVSKIYIYKKKHIYKVTGKENKQKNYEILLIIEL